jgi:hypothetical protein
VGRCWSKRNAGSSRLWKKGPWKGLGLAWKGSQKNVLPLAGYDLVVLRTYDDLTRVSTETLQPMDPSNLFFVFPEVIVLAKQCREKFP